MTRYTCNTRNIGLILLSVLMLIVSGCSGGDGDGSGIDSLAAAKTCKKKTNCPIAVAGPDQTVLVGTVATLDGSQSHSETAGLITYQWTLSAKPAGSATTLDGATTVHTTFTPDLAGSYSLSLVVSDGGVFSNPDSVTITAGTGNLAPIAEAGPARTVLTGALVALNGSGSYDPNGTPVTYAWTVVRRPKKSVMVLLNGTSATPSFTADVAGTYGLLLTVSDGTLTSSDQVEITAAKGNNGIAPVADAGLDQNVTTGHVVMLTGSGSTDANNDPLTYSWRFESKPTGSTATLAGATMVSPTFTPDLAGSYVLALGVNDGTVDSPLDMVVIKATLPGSVNRVLQAYVKASNTQAGDPFGNGDDRFGGSVALSGDTLAVGSFFEDSCAVGIGGDQADNGCSQSGAVYVFTRQAGVWSQQAYVKASNTDTQDFFGSSVALSGDTLAVGAPEESGCGTGIGGDQGNNSCSSAGAVYIFTRTAGLWSQQAYVKASNTDLAARFGSSIALSGDTLAVGAPFHDSFASLDNGAVYVFTRTAGLWSQQASIPGSISEAFDRFGGSVALSGDTLAVGSIFEDSCAIGIGGNQADNGCLDSGAVYVFTRTAGLWSQQAYVKASNTNPGDFFGSSVALSGNSLAVGAHREASCAIGIGGDQTNDSCPFSGAVYVFTRAAGVWNQQAYVKASNTNTDEVFGSSVALSSDTLAVGARDDSCATGIGGNQADNGCNTSGAVYIFTRQAGLWSQQAYVKASNTDTGDLFGVGLGLLGLAGNTFTSVALSGNSLAVGAQQEASCATGIGGDQTNNSCISSGAVYVYAEQ